MAIGCKWQIPKNGPGSTNGGPWEWKVLVIPLQLIRRFGNSTFFTAQVGDLRKTTSRPRPGPHRGVIDAKNLLKLWVPVHLGRVSSVPG
ncbi:hypothetical protein KC19_8G111900 [Ceratodon purpureus]|uniref:Uncharacterized protein n=1 Tax=Ceratodon purpureus TaxID=3225 RepID=A0A8T0H263_CERPU|nr:hypothetical protein KC19_8G111900 [Ceratodon purpureus]